MALRSRRVQTGRAGQGRPADRLVRDCRPGQCTGRQQRSWV